MSKKRNTTKKSKSMYFVACIVIVTVLIILYDVYIPKKIKDSYDIKVIAKSDEIHEDKILKTYEEYLEFLKSNLSSNQYKEEIDNNEIDEDRFDKYDYLALYYETRTCDDDGTYPNALQQLKTKVVINVIRYEDNDCNLNTRVTFIPVEKEKYDSIPGIVVKKEIIKK